MEEAEDSVRLAAVHIAAVDAGPAAGGCPVHRQEGKMEAGEESVDLAAVD